MFAIGIKRFRLVSSVGSFRVPLGKTIFGWLVNVFNRFQTRLKRLRKLFKADHGLRL